jgi:hypothetical protein
LTLKIEVIYSSETSVDFQWTTWCYIPEDGTLHNHCCENLKSHKEIIICKCCGVLIETVTGTLLFVCDRLDTTYSGKELGEMYHA